MFVDFASKGSRHSRTSLFGQKRSVKLAAQFARERTLAGACDELR